MARFTYIPCVNVRAGVPCGRPTWRRHPVFCNACYRQAQRAGNAPPPRRRRHRGPHVAPATVLFPTPEKLAADALVGMEAALSAFAARKGITPALAAQFERYQKVKALALGVGNPNEQRVALRMALIDAVKMVF